MSRPQPLARRRDISSDPKLLKAEDKVLNISDKAHYHHDKDVRALEDTRLRTHNDVEDKREELASSRRHGDYKVQRSSHKLANDDEKYGTRLNIANRALERQEVKSVQSRQPSRPRPGEDRPSPRRQSSSSEESGGGDLH